MQTRRPDLTEARTTDRDAILLMLSYVEAECRRLGAVAAARHAAAAAAALPVQGRPVQGRRARQPDPKPN